MYMLLHIIIICCTLFSTFIYTQYVLEEFVN